MQEMQPLGESLRQFLSIMERHGGRCAVVGGFAMMVHGEPRFTQDVDVVVEWPGEASAKRALITELAERYYLGGLDEQTGWAKGGMFTALDTRSGVKLDAYVRELVPGTLDRAQSVELIPGVRGPVASREDCIASKLYWISEGSHRSRKDVLGMLARPEPLDQALLERLADQLDVTHLLRELQGEIKKRREDDLPFERLGD